jgi:hypothetical protein
MEGYHQIPMHPDETPFGLFKYCKPGCPSVSARLATSLEEDGQNKLFFCFAFQDNLEVASRSDREHRQHLRIIFTRLREHALVINAEKAFSVLLLSISWSTGSMPLVSLLFHCTCPLWSSLPSPQL